MQIDLSAQYRRTRELEKKSYDDELPDDTFHIDNIGAHSGGIMPHQFTIHASAYLRLGKGKRI